MSPVSSEGPLQGLTKREQEVAGLLALGLSGAEIGRRLFLSGYTVKSRIGRIYRKLGVSNRTEFVMLVHRGTVLRPSAQVVADLAGFLAAKDFERYQRHPVRPTALQDHYQRYATQVLQFLGT